MFSPDQRLTDFSLGHLPLIRIANQRHSIDRIFLFDSFDPFDYIFFSLFHKNEEALSVLDMDPF